MIRQDWDGKDLDKDLRVLGSKTYSPETCCFVRREVNNLVVKNDVRRGLLPLGVYQKASKKNPYAAEVRVGAGSKKCLGSYATPLGAHRAWQQGKIEQALVLLSTENDPLVIQGLNRVINKIQADYDNGIETTDF